MGKEVKYVFKTVLDVQRLVAVTVGGGIDRVPYTRAQQQTPVA